MKHGVEHTIRCRGDGAWTHGRFDRLPLYAARRGRGLREVQSRRTIPHTIEGRSVAVGPRTATCQSLRTRDIRCDGCGGECQSVTGVSRAQHCAAIGAAIGIAIVSDVRLLERGDGDCLVVGRPRCLPSHRGEKIGVAANTWHDEHASPRGDGDSLAIPRPGEMVGRHIDRLRPPLSGGRSGCQRPHIELAAGFVDSEKCQIRALRRELRRALGFSCAGHTRVLAGRVQHPHARGIAAAAQKGNATIARYTGRRLLLRCVGEACERICGTIGAHRQTPQVVVATTIGRKYNRGTVWCPRRITIPPGSCGECHQRTVRATLQHQVPVHAERQSTVGCIRGTARAHQ